MLKLNPFRQTAGLCGPAALKIALNFWGIDKTEDELVLLTKTIIGEGTPGEKIVIAVWSLGLNAEMEDDSTFEKIQSWLEKGVPVMVDWFDEDDGHYAIVVDLDEINIYLQDPELADIRILPREHFFRVWFDFPGDFLRTKDDLVLRRLIAIYK
ncbi:MAG: cysteine peptidase family C39 domain-containing protein [Patescibacteria group bacterium]